MQQEIRISKRLLGMLALLATAIVFAITASLPGKASNPEATITPEVSASGAVAEAGVAATFTASYRQQDAWLEGICALSTADVCQFYTDFMAAGVWPQLEAKKAIITAKATAVEKVDEIHIPQEDGSTRTLENWRVAVKLSQPWPPRADEATEFTIYAQVTQEDGNWKFAGILLDGQAKRYEEQ